MKKLMKYLLSVLLLAGCTSQPVSETKDTKTELNTKELDMGDYFLLEDEDPAFEQISFVESFRLFDEKGTAVLLYSDPGCEYCNRAVPVLNEAAKEEGIKVYYVDCYEPEMTTEINEEIFLERLNILYEHLDPILEKKIDEQTGEKIPLFYLPTVIAIKDGVILDHHVSLTDDFHMESSETMLTEEQKAALKEIYINLIEKVYAQ